MKILCSFLLYRGFTTLSLRQLTSISKNKSFNRISTEAFIGANEGNRTPYPFLTMEVLYLLSYISIFSFYSHIVAVNSSVPLSRTDDLILTMDALRLAKLRAAASAFASAVLTYNDMFRSSMLGFLASLTYRASACIRAHPLVMRSPFLL